MDHKFSVEIAKLQALIENELGMQDENEIMDDDESDSQSSESSPKKRKSVIQKTKAGADEENKDGATDNEHTENNTLREGDEGNNENAEGKEKTKVGRNSRADANQLGGNT